MPYGANATGPDGPARRLREHGRADFADIETLHLARDHRMSYTPAMIVDIVSDVVCPWCYIGKRRFEQALAARPAFAVTTAWRAFQLNPDMPAEGMERQGYLADKFGSAARAASIYADITEAGLREDIAFAFDRILRTPNTILAHRLIRLSAAHGVQDAVVEALFRRYFEDGADIGNAEQLVEIGAEAGLDAEAAGSHLASDDGLDEVRAEDLNARRLGINGVPCFIIDQRYAVSGAQAPEVFERIFDTIDQASAAE